MKPVFQSNKLIGFDCELCNGYNDVLNTLCNYCKTNSNIPGEIRLKTILSRSGIGYDLEGIMSNQDIIELHSKFFNHERVMIKDMDTVAMHERREELRQIAFEAKARLTAHDDEERVRNANRSKEAKAWLLSPSMNDSNITDALNATKERKTRTSKADKMLEALKNLGVANADSLVAQAISKQTGAAISSTAGRVMVDKRPYPTSENCRKAMHHGCDGYAVAGDESIKCDCKCHKPKVVFNPANIFGKK